ncbi:hypothetical protein BZM27_12535 [Paraburkholderia steynii]|uniref:Uncharacterized protein n=1 Tax=Paraburkholderia steynii TaxID=1245441 RepID=A0A4R0XD78_9BURK|nr:hypothetical protein BZM27_12535 [Paraburkholderia steynii]
MSYSFTVTAATKDEAYALAEKEFDAVVAVQPNHATDKQPALANIDAALDLLSDDDAQDIRVSCNGSLMWVTDADVITGVSIAANAWYVPKTAA